MEDSLDAQIQRSLDDFRNRPIYRELSPEVIEKIPDDKLEMAVLDFVLEKLKPDGSNELDVLAELPEAIKASFLTFCLENDVDNGGFNQYFWNFSKQHAIETEKGFRLIGADDFADIVKKAIEIFEKEERRLKGFMQERTSEAFSNSYKDNPLSEVDTLFYSLERSTSKKRINFIRENFHRF